MQLDILLVAAKIKYSLIYIIIVSIDPLNKPLTLINMLKNIAKRLYDLIPFKKIFFLILKNIYLPSQKIYQHLHFKGVFNVFSGTNTFKIYHTGTVIENQLFWCGLDG